LQSLAEVATVVARALYRLAGGANNTSAIQADPKTVRADGIESLASLMSPHVLPFCLCLYVFTQHAVLSVSTRALPPPFSLSPPQLNEKNLSPFSSSLPHDLRADVKLHEPSTKQSSFILVPQSRRGR